MNTELKFVSPKVQEVPSTGYDYVTKEEYELSKAWGLATAIDLHDCDPDLLKNAEAIKDYAGKLCALIEAKPWGPCHVQHFGVNPDVAGYSMMQLVETSLVSGHFANKTNRIFLDIFSCKYYDAIKAIEFSKEFFRAKDVSFRCLIRK